MISIITSLYKSDEYLETYAKNLKFFAGYLSVLNQPFEIIVVANEPTEKERQLQQEFKGQNWFSFYAVEREPLYATWNRGVSLAKGEIVGFWNVDDRRYPESLIEAQKLFNNGAEMVFLPFKICRYVKFLGMNIFIHKQNINKQIPEFKESSQKEFQRSMLCGPFFMFTKNLYERVGPFDEQFKIAGDFDWCVRAAKKSAKLVKAKSLGGEFRLDGKGLSAGGSPRQLVENNLIYKRFGATDKICPEDAELASQYRMDAIKYQGNYIDIKKYV